MRHQHGACGQQRAFHILAAYAQEVSIGHAVGLVVLALVAALFERLFGQCCGRAGACNQHGIRLGTHDLECLASYRGVGAREGFGGHQLHALGFGSLLEFLQPAFAISVVEADEANGLHTALGHVIGNGASHHAVVLRCLEDPLLLVVHGRDDPGRGTQRDHGSLALGDHVDHGQRVGRGAGANDDVGLAFADELACVGNSCGGVRCVVQNDVVDLLATHGLGHQGHGVFLGDAQRGSRPGGGNHHTDRDIRKGCAPDSSQSCRDQTQFCNALHACLLIVAHTQITTTTPRNDGQRSKRSRSYFGGLSGAQECKIYLGNYFCASFFSALEIGVFTAPIPPRNKSATMGAMSS